MSDESLYEAWRKFLIPDEAEWERQREALGTALDNTTFHGTDKGVES